MALPGDEILRSALEGFYGDLAGAGTAARRVGWESDAAHRLRLRAIIEQLTPLDAFDSLLDAGCGEGRLLAELRAAGYRGTYRGEDMLQHHVDRAAAAFEGDADAAFACVNTIAATSPAAVVVCSGTLNTRASASRRSHLRAAGALEVDLEHEALVAGALKALWARCEDTLIVDLAILDRHPPGVGIGRVRLPFIHELLRSMAPAVAVLEDAVPGEALFVASRNRRRGALRRLSTAAERAEVLLAAGDGVGALRVLDLSRDSGGDLRENLLRGAALAMTGALDSAEAHLESLQVHMVDDEDARRVALAPVKWQLGKKEAAKALLLEAATRSDEARTHLAQLLAGTGDRAGARAVVAAIADAWTRRELERQLGD